MIIFIICSKLTVTQCVKSLGVSVKVPQIFIHWRMQLPLPSLTFWQQQLPTFLSPSGWGIEHVIERRRSYSRILSSHSDSNIILSVAIKALVYVYMIIFAYAIQSIFIYIITIHLFFIHNYVTSQIYNVYHLHDCIFSSSLNFKVQNLKPRRTRSSK